MNKIANKFRWLVWFMCGLCTACTVYDTPADIAGGSSEVSKKTTEWYVTCFGSISTVQEERW